MNDAITIIVM